LAAASCLTPDEPKADSSMALQSSSISSGGIDWLQGPQSGAAAVRSFHPGGSPIVRPSILAARCASSPSPCFSPQVQPLLLRCNRRVQWYKDNEGCVAQLDAASPCRKPGAHAVDLVEGRCDPPSKLSALSSVVVSGIRNEVVVVSLQLLVLLGLSLITLILLRRC
jgi:hypothetical protein